MAIKRVISALQDLPGLEWQVWFLDDGVLAGEPDDLNQLSPQFQHLGLHVNITKCKIWSPHSVVLDSPVPVVDWSSPKVVLGTPFGSDAAVSQFLTETRAKHHALLCRLAQFPDPQVALAILRYCLGAQKINHLLRVLWNPIATTFAEDTEHDLRFTLDCTLGSCLPYAAWKQCCLPIRLGGFGVQNPTLTHSAAYFASALAEYAGAKAPPSDTLWAAARDLCGRIESAELSQWLGLVALPSPAQIVKE